MQRSLVKIGDAVLSILLAGGISAQTTGIWSRTGNLNQARFNTSATLLNNDGRWRATGSMNVARAEHTATLLPNGKVLVAGGIDSAGNISEAAETYDPVSGRWTVFASMNSARRFARVALLSSGKVMVAGGQNYTIPQPADCSQNLPHGDVISRWRGARGRR